MHYYYTGQYRHNKNGKWAWVRTHGNPKHKDRVS